MMNKPFIEIDAEHFTISAFEIIPIEGYEIPVNSETGENFPNCCTFHKSIYEVAQDWFLKFPDCCDQHKAMVSKSWFNKANYSGIAEKIVKQLSYTEHHISEHIDIDNWYKDITDYIEFSVSSFGHPAIGLDLYLGNLKHYIQNTENEILSDKKQRIIEFIETYYNNPKEYSKTDINILYSTYQKWLKVFPFDITFFSTLKPQFENQLPIMNGKPEKNKYTGFSKVKMHTKDSLIDVLLNLTNNLITQINTSTLYEKGLLSEPQKIKLELILNERKMKLKEGYANSSNDEGQRYRKILKEWFADEKSFIGEVIPLVKALPSQDPKTNKPKEDEKELHNNIFKSNAFEVFEKYHTNKNLSENCKTDLSILFQLFEKNNLFIETVELKHFIRWLNKTYGYAIIELKKVDINSKPNKQRTNDYNEYKRTTLKQP